MNFLSNEDKHADDSVRYTTGVPYSKLCVCKPLDGGVPVKNGDGASVLKLLQSIDRAIQLFLRLKISEIKGDRNQSDMILLLDSVGFKSGEIIELLGASAGTVRPILSRAHKKKKK